MDIGWLGILRFGVVFLLAARPAAAATVNAADRYRHYSREKKARLISVLHGGRDGRSSVCSVRSRQDDHRFHGLTAVERPD